MILKTSIENIRRDEKSVSPVMDLEIERDDAGGVYLVYKASEYLPPPKAKR